MGSVNVSVEPAHIPSCELSTEAHADAMLTEFGIAAWVCGSNMEMVRNRLIKHLEAAEERGKDIRDMFTGDNE